MIYFKIYIIERLIVNNQKYECLKLADLSKWDDNYNQPIEKDNEFESKEEAYKFLLDNKNDLFLNQPVTVLEFFDFKK